MFPFKLAQNPKVGSWSLATLVQKMFYPVKLRKNANLSVSGSSPSKNDTFKSKMISSRFQAMKFAKKADEKTFPQSNKFQILLLKDLDGIISGYT